TRRSSDLAHRGGDAVGGLEPDAAHVESNPVWRALDDARGAVSVMLDAALREAGGRAVRLELHEHAAQRALRAPALLDLLNPLRAEPRQLGEALRRMVEHLQRGDPEFLDDA